MFHLKLRGKLLFLGVALGVIPICIIGGIVLERNEAMLKIAARENNHSALSGLDNITSGVYTMCQAQLELQQKSLDSALSVAEDIMKRAGALSLSQQQTKWNAENQFTKESRSLTVPAIVIGDTRICHNSDPKIESTIVDEVKRLVGVTCTIFQMVEPEGDLLRICTNVMKKDGTRAIGTYIPKTGPDGIPNPVVSAILSDKSYRGRAFVVDRWYLTAYEPLKDSAGKIIGALYVGIPQENVESLRKGILATKVGKTGYVFVLDTKGNYVISKEGKRDGENIYDSKDNDGRSFIKEICDQAKALKPGEIGNIAYSWKNPGENSPREKVARFMYFAPWDWVIASSAYTSEFYAGVEEVKNAGAKGTKIILMVIIASVAVTIFCWTWIAGNITKPIKNGVKFAETMAGGDFSQTFDENRNDEMGVLAASFNRMTKEIGYIISTVVHGVKTLNASSDRLSLFSGKIGRTLVQMSEKTEAAAGRAEEMRENMKSVAAAMEQSAGSVSIVASSTAEMSATINKIAKNSETARNITKAAVHKVSTASDIVKGLGIEAQSIGAVTEAISEISAQTNLLALNATIEAARAGEAGKGFAVVASEIKALSAQTAQATEDIRSRIETIRESANQTVNVIGEINKVIGDVESIVTGIVGAMDEQSASTAAIAANVSQAAEGIDITRENVSQTFVFSEEMTREISDVSRFAGDVATESKKLDSHASELAELSGQLTDIVGKFKVDRTDKADA